MAKNAAKPRKHWFRNKNVVAGKKELLHLKRAWKADVLSIKEIADSYNDLESAEQSLEALPLKNAKEFYDYVQGNLKEFNLQMMEKRTKLRKEHSSKIEELDILESKINEQELEILLSQIKCVQDKLGSE